MKTVATAVLFCTAGGTSPDRAELKKWETVIEERGMRAECVADQGPRRQ